jgi:transposase-like protein
MKKAEDLLLDPLITGDPPVCPNCASPLSLVGFHAERGKPDFAKFRCPGCGRSETFADDNDSTAVNKPAGGNARKGAVKEG